MNATILELIKSALEIKNAELTVIRNARYERIMAAISDKNNGLEPNKDYQGRLHAPCDGYEHWDTGQVYGKGEYITMPTDDMKWTDGSYIDFRARGKLRIDFSICEKLKELVYKYGVEASNGQVWESKGVEVCNLYMKGEKSFINAIVHCSEQEQEQKKEAMKAFKGKAPAGLSEVKAKLICVKSQPGYGWGTTDYKMLVELENKSTAYGTMPKALLDNDEAVKGYEFMLKANFQPAQNDETHAFFKRPQII